MNNYKKEALNTINRDAYFWATSLIVGLEEHQQHSAIIWVADILQQYITKADYAEKEEWLKWLKELKNISIDENRIFFIIVLTHNVLIQK